MTRLDAKPLSGTERDAGRTAGLHKVMHESGIAASTVFAHNIFQWVSSLIAIRPNGELPCLSWPLSELDETKSCELRTGRRTKGGYGNVPIILAVDSGSPFGHGERSDDWSESERHHVRVNSGHQANIELRQQIIQRMPRDVRKRIDLISNSRSAAP